VQAPRTLSIAAGKSNLAAYMPICVEYPAPTLRMAVVRLDRAGLTARIADDAMPPPLSLPRPARIVSGTATLCELRLVARGIARPCGHALELTMQPSRPDDNLSLWQALYASRHLYRGAADVPVTATVSEELAASETSLLDGSLVTCDSGVLSYGLGCEAVFRFADSSEALFFSEWLECHFAEIAAYGRAASWPTELRDMRRYRRVTDVRVVFSYRRGSHAVQHGTEEICNAIAADMERLFGILLQHELAADGERIVLLPNEPQCWGSAKPRCYSFSSK
jgi:hypothetical protein